MSITVSFLSLTSTSTTIGPVSASVSPPSITLTACRTTLLSVVHWMFFAGLHVACSNSIVACVYLSSARCSSCSASWKLSSATFSLPSRASFVSSHMSFSAAVASISLHRATSPWSCSICVCFLSISALARSLLPAVRLAASDSSAFSFFSASACSFKDSRSFLQPSTSPDVMFSASCFCETNWSYCSLTFACFISHLSQACFASRQSCVAASTAASISSILAFFSDSMRSVVCATTISVCSVWNRSQCACKLFWSSNREAISFA